MISDRKTVTGSRPDVDVRPFPRAGSGRADDVGPVLPLGLVLVWADALLETHGIEREEGTEWPSLPVKGEIAESWKVVDRLLGLNQSELQDSPVLGMFLAGLRGAPLPEFVLVELARLARAWRGGTVNGRYPRSRRRPRPSPRKTVTPDSIVSWANAHYADTGRWPGVDSGLVRHAPFNITWAAIDERLRLSRQLVPVPTTLSELIADRCELASLTDLSLELVLAWADAHFAARQHWPTAQSGFVPGSAVTTWRYINYCLQSGAHGLPGGTDLGRLLADQRGVDGPTF